jgi:uncharacterized protein YdcH (DUF465 family)
MSVLISESELREQLLRTNPEYRRLAAEHKSYSEQLEVLNSRHYLSEEEKIQEITLKKKKLLLKDQMYSLLQRFRKELEV